MNFEGETVGSIRVGARIGRGGMGSVYRGVDRSLKRPVALKALAPEVRANPDMRARFIREARLLSRLDHPNICRVYDLIEHPRTDVLVLELIEGRTLREVDAEAMTLDERLAIAERVADAMAAAHREQILHRDLKPENIMLTPAGEVKVLDFGIARPVELHSVVKERARNSAAGDEPTSSGRSLFEAIDPGGADREARIDSSGGDALFHTAHRRTLGTVAYMSPEQALGQPLTVASDVYAFGVLLQELLTGERAYPDLPKPQLLIRVARGDVVPPNALPPEQRSLLRDLQELEPSDRPSAGETLRRIRRLRSAPERNRRRVAVAVLVCVLAGLLGFAVDSRLDAARATQAAQELARLASEVEWRMRAEHLAPAHSLTASREEVERQMAELVRITERLDGLDRGTGELALGRAALALGRLDDAIDHLTRAWALGQDSVATSAHLALAIFERYQQELETARRIGSRELRQQRLEALASSLRDPALAHLERVARADPRPAFALVPPHYTEAVVAFYAQDLEAVRAASARVLASAPWFYDVLMLEARAEEAAAWASVDVGEVEAGLAALGRAEALMARAETIGRSDPDVPTLACDILSTRLILEVVYTVTSADQKGATYRRGGAACRRALALEEDSPRALRLLAELELRRAESQVDLDDPRVALDDAIRMAELAARARPDDADPLLTIAKALLVRADWENSHSGRSRSSLDRALEVLQQALELRPNDPELLNLLGVSYSYRADLEWNQGADPSEAARRSLDAFERAMEVVPDLMTARSNRIGEIARLAAWQLVVGNDPTPLVDEQRRLADEALAIDPGDRFVLRDRAQGELLAARWQMQDQTEARDRLAVAESLARRALADSADPYTEALLAEVLSARAERALATGGDPQPALDALGELEVDLAAGSAFVPGLLQLAALHRLRAANVEDPAARGRHLQAARRVAEQALDVDPERAEAQLELAEIERRLGRLDAQEGRDPDAAWRRAEAALARAADLWGQRPEPFAAQARLALDRADRADGAERRRRAENGLAAARRAVELHAGDAGLGAIVDQLEFLAGPAVPAD
ncbi:MAG: protein kinase [Acidobacteriota bacterium]